MKVTPRLVRQVRDGRPIVQTREAQPTGQAIESATPRAHRPATSISPGDALLTLLDSVRVAGCHDRIDGEPDADDERLWAAAHAALPHLIPAESGAAPQLLTLIRRAYDAGYHAAPT